MTHRTFEAAEREETGEPLTFNVGGFDHTFTIQTPLRMGQLIIFSRAVKSGKKEEQVFALDKLMHDWLVPADRDKWDECLSELTDLEVLMDIVNYVVEEATGRPTQASST